MLFFAVANNNRYEGAWENDMKHGMGKFLHLDKGQVYTGYWRENVAKSGVLEDFDREAAPNPPQYLIPPCTLTDPEDVLRKAREEIDSEMLS